MTSDHECTTLEEAEEKIRRGQWIMIREGTASKNLSALYPLLNTIAHKRCVLACDDKHSGDIMREGHIDCIIKRAIALGVEPATVYTAASFNAAERFGLRRIGAVAPGYFADLVLLDDIKNVSINTVIKRGIVSDKICRADHTGIDDGLRKKVYHTVHLDEVNPSDFKLNRFPEKVIRLIPGQILTEYGGEALGVDVENDIVKLAVVERHKNTGHIGCALLSGYGLKHGAVATTVAHDSHNVIVAGVTDEDIAFAVNRLREIDGGMVVVRDGKIAAELSLPIAGLMCELSDEEVDSSLEILKKAARNIGVSDGIDPFMTLSFASLPVIPKLRLTTFGVFDVESFSLI